MRLVVRILRVSLAVGAEVGIMADGTLIAVTPDVAAAIGAKRTVTGDTAVMLLIVGNVLQRLVQRCEAMTRVRLGCGTVAGGAEVKIWASQALIAYADNYLEVVSICFGSLYVVCLLCCSRHR